MFPSLGINFQHQNPSLVATVYKLPFRSKNCLPSVPFPNRVYLLSLFRFGIHNLKRLNILYYIIFLPIEFKEDMVWNQVRKFQVNNLSLAMLESPIYGLVAYFSCT